MNFHTRVARWHIFKPKIPIWVNFGGSNIQLKMLEYFVAIWSILWPFGLFVAIWSILWPFGIFYSYLVYVFFQFWYVVPRKIWQPCFKHVQAS
jgi:hypothetical protein